MLDKQMDGSNTFVYKGKLYYDSHCLNKDIPVLINFASEVAPFMTARNKIKKTKLSD